jgi:hypothetical protein
MLTYIQIIHQLQKFIREVSAVEFGRHEVSKCITCHYSLFIDTGSPILFHWRVLAALFYATYRIFQSCFILRTDTWQPCSVPLTSFLQSCFLYAQILGCPVLCHLRVFFSVLFSSTYRYWQPCSVPLTGLGSPVFFYVQTLGSPVLRRLRVFAALFSSTYRYLAALFCITYGFLLPCLLLCTDTWLPCAVPLTGFCRPLLFYLLVLAALLCSLFVYLQPCYILLSKDVCDFLYTLYKRLFITFCHPVLRHRTSVQ